MVRAAVMTNIGAPLEIRHDIEVSSPGPGELAVRMAASGVCHSDLSVQNGATMAPLPIVLGHEGAGVVAEVGEGVNSVQPGDHVITCWVAQCGVCFWCSRGEPHLCEGSTVPLASGGLLDGTTRLAWRGSPLFQFLAAGTFSELTIVPEVSALKVDDDLDLRVAALIGCAVVTGVGAATNTAKISEGDSVVIVGCGGVGLNVVQGARLQGAEQVIAVDVGETKLETARRFGATQVVDAKGSDPVARVMALTGQRGADVTFEVVGLESTIDQAIAMTRRGGQAILVGIPRIEARVKIPALLGMVMSAKTIKGCWYGSADVRRDVPRLVELYRRGVLALDELITRTVTLEEVNQAFAAMERGEVARTVILYA